MRKHTEHHPDAVLSTNGQDGGTTIVAENNRIVCIGASAGGMEAIHELFDNLPSDTGFSFIVIQHLSSDHKSLMAELLARHTTMRVLEARENTIVEPNCVYVIPNNRNITIHNGMLLLSGKEQGRTPNMPIDIFLHSLAGDIGDKAIAIILSGTGTDGTRGVAEIKKAGGLVFVQDPTTAKFDGMPYSAISSGQMDFILSPESIAEELVAQHIKPPSAVIVDALPAENEPVLTDLLNVIKSKTGLDFRLYKRPTIIRRLTRRMAFNNCSLPDYLTLLRQNDGEVELLVKEFLVGVTRFFRDEPAFEELKLKVIPEIIKDKNPQEPIKIWVAGCSTGEEAYSLAILLREHLDRSHLTNDVKIFGSDINRDALEFASRGLYGQAIIHHVPAGALEKYFIKEDGKYRVVSQLRKMIVFSHHDLAKDPPFGRIDLVCCRNMLIYVSPELQKRILALFNFAMRLGGYIFLGPSENIGILKDNMVEVSKKWKIYRKVKPAKPLVLEPASYTESPARRLTSPPLTPDRSRRNLLEGVLNKVMEQYSIAAVLVDKDSLIIETFGNYTKYLRLPEKKFDNNLLKMLPPRPSVMLGANLRKALATQQDITLHELRFDAIEEEVSITIKPFPDHLQHPVALIIFSEIEAGKLNLPTTTTEPSRSQVATYDGKELTDINILQQELSETKEVLQKAIEESETTNEELQSANEELISSNEELQSANEELQSLNEELHTVNAENQLRIKQIMELNDDLNNYFASNDIGQVFLDRNSVIRKYTPQATGLINLIETDVGRPITHISNNISYSDLSRDINYVLKHSAPLVKSLRIKNNTWYQMKIMPYLREDKTMDGVVLTFIDITAMKKAEKELKNANRKLRELNDNLLRSNRELEQFAYITSHDLQEPLRKIQTFVDLIQRSHHDADTIARYLDKISHCASRMSLLITDVLSYARLTRTDEAVRETDLNTVLENIKSDFEFLINERKATITNDNLPVVKGYPRQLQQLFANLIGNSLKFCDTEPHIHIGCELVSAEALQSVKELDHRRQYFQLSVRDNGIGFDPQYADRVFTIFQRLNNKKDYKGTGIGLSLCKRIVENHNGHIDASSVPGEGSTFTVYLPAT